MEKQVDKSNEKASKYLIKNLNILILGLSFISSIVWSIYSCQESDEGRDLLGGNMQIAVVFVMSFIFNFIFYILISCPIYLNFNPKIRNNKIYSFLSFFSLPLIFIPLVVYLNKFNFIIILISFFGFSIYTFFYFGFKKFSSELYSDTSDKIE
jgi:hypothetical protein